MSNSPWKSDSFFSSPWNYLPEVTQTFQMPEKIQIHDVIALETYPPANDGRSAARIEEEIVVTASGPQIITLFPREELMVANEY
jgi:Xaa-Pro aminopeptidase